MLTDDEKITLLAVINNKVKDYNLYIAKGLSNKYLLKEKLNLINSYIKIYRSLINDD